ncbi:MAG: SDR family oxidoreductase [Saprospiraceae bacterium]|uniref:SDR family oxidoreductase n=1 Tax=Candidatus Opimibacter skivensis TaxID=2982028 RepID=A0A9D7SU46_9BACT|nr:SDR family oxidoreductase [Candidatus Opimibacter skivensis]
MAYALITGASGGIGWAMARELASRKHDILLLARSGEQLQKNAEELRRVFNVNADFLAIDLSAPDVALNVRDWLSQKNYSIDILINNAGYAVWGKMQNLTREEINAMMRLNMFTLSDMCKVLLPMLQNNKRAYIMNVSSTSAYQAVGTLANYAATKAFVLVFTRGLRKELKGTNVSATCLSPGPTSTGFVDRANMGAIKEKAEKFSVEPESVAKAGINGMLADKAEIVPGVLNYVGAKMAEILPKGLIEKIAMDLYIVKDKGPKT